MNLRKPEVDQMVVDIPSGGVGGGHCDDRSRDRCRHWAAWEGEPSRPFLRLSAGARAFARSLPGSVAITAHAILFLAVLPSSTSIVRPKRLAAALGADSAWKLENFRAAFAFRRVPDAHDHGFLFEGALPRPHVRRRILHAASWNL